MNKIVRNIIDRLTGKPKTLFLIDSLGAMLTALFLFVVLRNLNEYFGMPITILAYLSTIAACFCIYSTACFIFLKENWTPFIRAIGISNLLYCVLTMGLILVYYPILTSIGIAYFLVEIIIICGLIYIEFKVATEISKNRLINM
jgi:ABC-type long-subunit fatty acid transport system fused permease/ATPase subunit